MQPVYCLYRSSGRIPTVLRRYPYGHCTKRNPHRRTFRQNTEEYGQTLPAVLEPNGMNFWTPQTQDTEANVRLPIITKIRNTRFPQFTLDCRRLYTGLRFHDLDACIGYTEISSPRQRKPVLSPRRNSNARLLLCPSQRLFHLCRNDRTFPFSHFRFTYNQPEDAYLIVNPNSDEGKGYIEIDTIKNRYADTIPSTASIKAGENPPDTTGTLSLNIK